MKLPYSNIRLSLQGFELQESIVVIRLIFLFSFSFYFEHNLAQVLFSDLNNDKEIDNISDICSLGGCSSYIFNYFTYFILF